MKEEKWKSAGDKNWANNYIEKSIVWSLDTCRCVPGLSCFWHTQSMCRILRLENTRHGCIKSNLCCLLLSLFTARNDTRSCVFDLTCPVFDSPCCVFMTHIGVFSTHPIYVTNSKAPIQGIGIRMVLKNNCIPLLYQWDPYIISGTSSKLMVKKTTWAIFSPLKITILYFTNNLHTFNFKHTF